MTQNRSVGWLETMQRAVDARRTQIKQAVSVLIIGATEDVALAITFRGKALEATVRWPTS